MLTCKSFQQVVKKIDETRKRANQITNQRDRNQKHLQEKMARQDKIRRDEAIKREMNLQNKEMNQAQVKASKDLAKNTTKMQAMETKKEKMDTKNRNMNQKAYEEAKARERKNMIQQQKMAAAQQREIEF